MNHKIDKIVFYHTYGHVRFSAFSQKMKEAKTSHEDLKDLIEN